MYDLPPLVQVPLSFCVCCATSSPLQMVRLQAIIKGLHQNAKPREIKEYLAPRRVKVLNFKKNGRALLLFYSPSDLASALTVRGKLHGKDLRITVDKADEKKTSKMSSEESNTVKWPVRSTTELKKAISESGRLFVRNLSYECTEEDIEKLFQPFGALSEIHLAYDVNQKISKGFAFVTFLFPPEAVTAYQKLDKTKFKGRLLHILPADDPLELQSAPRDPQTVSSKNVDEATSQLMRSSFQEVRHQELKSSASTGHNWNSLFIRPDAVVTYLAAKFGLNKEQVLNPTTASDSVAVRLAHGESQLVAEMKEFLEKQGVRLNAFSSGDDSQASSQVGEGGRRDRLEAKSSLTRRLLSGTAFLIKNLPIGTSELEVRELLASRCSATLKSADGIGEKRSRPSTLTSSDEQLRLLGVKRLIVPKLGITAIVEFEMPQQARLVFKKLAYEPFQDGILFLQWLPNGALRPSSDPTPEPGAKRRKGVNPDDTAESHRSDKFDVLTQPPDANCQQSAVAVTSALVNSDEEAPGDVVLPGSTDVSVPRKAKKRSARKSLESVPKTEEDAGAQDIKRSRRSYKNKKERLRQTKDVEATAAVVDEKEDEPTTVEEQQPSEEQAGHREDVVKPTKPVLLVRNVAFQANEKEVMQLFKPIGGLVKVRLPVKATGGHRGFAFLEFAHLDQAESAVQTLGANTHLYGRRLRIEYAKVV